MELLPLPVDVKTLNYASHLPEGQVEAVTNSSEHSALAHTDSRAAKTHHRTHS